MRKLIGLSFIFFFVFGCKKEKEKKFSEWFVNGERFYSNDVVATVAKGNSGIHSNIMYREGRNYFNIAFTVGFSFPPPGSYPIRHVTGQNPDSVVVNFYYHDHFYRVAPSNRNFLQLKYVNDKVECSFPPGWFLNYDNPADSVQMYGSFNEP